MLPEFDREAYFFLAGRGEIISIIKVCSAIVDCAVTNACPGLPNQRPGCGLCVYNNVTFFLAFPFPFHPTNEIEICNFTEIPL